MIALFFGLLISTANAQDLSPQMSAMDVGEYAPKRHAITTGIVVPQPLSIGYEFSFEDLPAIHFFAEGGYFYFPMSGKLKKISVWSVQAGARLFPLENWLYFTGALGFRQIGLGTDISNLKLDGVSLANRADLTLNAAIFTLGIGGQWFLSENVAFSTEIGVQFPIPGLHGGNTSIVQDSSDGSDLGVDDADALYRVTNIPVPQIALIRFIWYID